MNILDAPYIVEFFFILSTLVFVTTLYFILPALIDTKTIFLKASTGQKIWQKNLATEASQE
jgi:hypothetical protein